MALVVDRPVEAEEAEEVEDVVADVALVEAGRF